MVKFLKQAQVKNTWYDPGKVKFGFWRKKCIYLILRQQSYFLIQPLDWTESLHGVSCHVILRWVKISGQLEFEKASQYGSTEAVQILLFTSFWLVDFLFG